MLAEIINDACTKSNVIISFRSIDSERLRVKVMNPERNRKCEADLMLKDLITTSPDEMVSSLIAVLIHEVEK